MASRLLLLSIFVLFILIEQIQGAPKRYEESRNDAFSGGHPLATSDPFNTQRRNKTPCNCKGKKMHTLCPCPQPVNGKSGIWKQRSQQKKCKNLRKRLPRNKCPDPFVVLSPF